MGAKFLHQHFDNGHLWPAVSINWLTYVKITDLIEPSSQKTWVLSWSRYAKNLSVNGYYFLTR